MASESLRDTIEAAVTSAENEAAPQTEVTSTAPVETEKPQASETAADGERTRDEKGRFAATETKNETEPQKTVSQTAAPKYQRPSSWRKETWGVWDKLNANQPLSAEDVHLLAAEAIKRDSDYANGVSAYKREWETAKPLIDAMEPFMPDLQANNIAPAQWIANLGNAHKMLALGTPEQKLSMFSRLAQEYQIPIEKMFVRGEDGQLYRNPNLDQPMLQPQQPAVGPQDVQRMVSEALAQTQAAQEAAQFSQNTEKYPHFEALREDMARLLEAGFAEGLHDAYEAAMRLPKNAQFYDAMQQQQSGQELQRAQEEKRKAADLARRKAVSPRSSTPTSAASQGQAKGIRASLESAFEEHAAGRV